MAPVDIPYGIDATPETIPEAFVGAMNRFPGKTALMCKDGSDEYQPITFEQLGGCVDRVAASIKNLGVGKGDRVAIFAYHGPEWVIADLAVLKLGGVIVPIYHTLSPSAVKYIVNDSGCKLLFAEDDALFDVIDGIRGECQALTDVVVFKTEGRGENRCASKFCDLVENNELEGQAALSDLPQISGDDAATIVYTSGTTGEPKGVVLSHRNIVSNSLAVAKRFKITSGDVFLSFLPLCHMFERTCGYYTMLFSGATIAYAGSLTTIVSDVQKVRPTILIIVPRLLEKIYEAVEAKVMESPAIRRKMVAATIQCLNRQANLRYRGHSVSYSLRVKCYALDKLVASKFRKIAGGNLRVLVSGGAALDRKLAKALYVLGFNILEGYGLTEASPVVCAACPEEYRLGTVGKPIDDVDVMIGEGDEILVQGPNIMQGYFNKPQETIKVIDEDGWFHTGDQGRFDDDGNLIITGRIKEIIVTSYGKNVAPVPIEAEINKSCYIDQSILFGDNRKYIAAIIVPFREAIERYARDNNIAFANYSELLARDEIKGLIEREIENATVDRARYEKVKAFSLLPESFSVANKMLTPTLKLRRKKVLERYQDEIESMYAE